MMQTTSADSVHGEGLTNSPTATGRGAPPEARENLKSTLLLSGSGLIVLAAYGTLGMFVALRMSLRWIWDDSYMFVRYADNFLSEGVLAWNPGGPATYGLTSILFLAIVIPVRAVLSNQPSLTAALSSLACGIAFLVLVSTLIYLHAGQSKTQKLVLLAFAALAVAMGHSVLAEHFVSGMDTLFAMSFMTGYILLAKRCERAPSRSGMVALSLVGGLTFFARPDLLLYTVLVPLSMAIFSQERKQRVLGIQSFLGVGVILVIDLVITTYYFGSALPLPFYAKTLGLYDDFDYAAAGLRYASIQYLLVYISSYWLLFSVICVGIFVNWRRWLNSLSPVDRALVVSTILFVSYYLFFVLQIMPMGARFYHPMLPAIIFISSKSLANIMNEYIAQSSNRAILPSVRFSIALIFMILFMHASWMLPLFSDGNTRAILRTNFMRYNIESDFREERTRVWYGLHAFSALPDDLVIATTEVGNPAALNPRKRIIDLAGLNDTTFAHHRFSQDVLLRQHQPDLIYLPHVAYVGMHNAIIGSPVFQMEYEYFPSETLGATMGVAIRRDSPYYPAMRQILEVGRVPSS